MKRKGGDHGSSFEEDGGYLLAKQEVVYPIDWSGTCRLCHDPTCHGCPAEGA